MRIMILASSLYSERALAVLVSLCSAGHKPVACVCVKTIHLQNIRRKLAQYGWRDFLGYAWRRLRPPIAGKDSPSRTASSLFADWLKAHGVEVSNLSQACRHYGIPLRLVSDVNQPAVLEFLRRSNPDLIVYTGGGILRPPLLAIPRKGVLNGHAGLLPRYRGMNVVEWALLEGNEIGVTVHFIDSGIDTGAIVLTKAVTPAIQDTSLSALSQRIVYITVDALVEAVRQLAKEEAGEMRQPAGGGKQYFVMHEKLRSLAEQQLTDRRNRYSA